MDADSSPEASLEHALSNVALLLPAEREESLLQLCADYLGNLDSTLIRDVREVIMATCSTARGDEMRGGCALALMLDLIDGQLALRQLQGEV